MEASFYPYELIFKRPSGTSRGILKTKRTYFLEITKDDKKSVGECGYFEGLSLENYDLLKTKLYWLSKNIELPKEEIEKELSEFPCVQFAYEQAMSGLESTEKEVYFPSEFTSGRKGIKINGLIWMGDVDFMRSQIQNKLEEGFKCIKLKIGVNWQEEKKILSKLRNSFSEEELELRVDANGAFSYTEAKKVLEELSQLKIHSIEQPIRQGNTSEMQDLCLNSPMPIALDEELIGLHSLEQKEELIQKIKPQYLILKPSLIGGIKGTSQWIELGKKHNILWWITSALESNIGLNFLAQWTYKLNNTLPQGLGTGSLFLNNFPSNLKVLGEELRFTK
ncbi:MAG: o-succinylbenzoate synthase [Flavobacteriales bacterium]|nr:o-succinylbenzoate synthase [Flavobacteriales bacterium]